MDSEESTREEIGYGGNEEDGCVVTKPDKIRKSIIRGKAKCRKVVWASMEKRSIYMHGRVGIDLIKLIKSSIKSLIKSMRINQGIDLFDFFKIICTHVITDA